MSPCAQCSCIFVRTNLERLRHARGVSLSGCLFTESTCAPGPLLLVLSPRFLLPLCVPRGINENSCRTRLLITVQTHQRGGRETSCQILECRLGVMMPLALLDAWHHSCLFSLVKTERQDDKTGRSRPRKDTPPTATPTVCANPSNM
jgi:hypothetical protein